MVLRFTDPVAPSLAMGTSEAEALFKEARRRRWKRRAIAFVVVALVASAVSWFVAARGQSHGGSPVTVNAQTFAHSAISATLATGGAKFSFTSEEQPRPVTGCNPLLPYVGRKAMAYDRAHHRAVTPNRFAGVPLVQTTGTGTIDFATSTVAFSEGTQSCGTTRPVFCAFPDSVIETTAALYTYSAYTGTTCYGGPKGSSGQIIRGPKTTRPWTETSSSPSREYLGGQGGVDEQLFSESPLSVLSGLAGRVARIGPANVDGVAATEYAGHTTLAAIQLIEGYDPVLTRTQGTLVPLGKNIPIRVWIWLDSQGRVRQIRAAEPLYLAVQASGSAWVNAVQTFSTTVSHGGELRQQNYAIDTVDFSSFGTRVKITSPSASQVLQSQ